MRKLGAVVLLSLLAACGGDNIALAPKPAEKETQFILERSAITETGVVIYVIRDKVNNKLIYVVPKCGVAVEDE